ncbi:MAG TPA: GNAT family N-acetyltransferase [Anaerolineales bacterium]|nr:GNAT family N-acetyltransferase [Anaerolineales bacterium]
MSKPAASVVELSPSAEGRAADVLTRAFADDPFYSFLFPEEQRRLRFTRNLWRALIHTCRILGKVYATAGLEGVACWAAPGRDDLTFARALRTGFALPISFLRAPEKPRRLLFRAVEILDGERRRLMTGRFWYLQALGVEPGRQGQGIGSRLLAPILAVADAEKSACYLETVKEDNLAFYAKHGFQVLSHLEFPGTPIELWTMRRGPA